jgi:hypothetical protein|nr:MAG TPA: hypothetical protein [Caudoviricetes sp.]
MPIKRITLPVAIDNYVTGRIEAIQKALAYNLAAIGEQVLNVARLNGSYRDQTGNLRSSIGYVVVIDGEVIQMSSFDAVKSGGNGARMGKQYVKRLIRKFPQGVVLLVVAGMKYASYVSAKGYDVLDSSELLADKLVPQMLEQLGLKH